MRIVMSCLIRFALAAMLAMLASAAPAQPYPTRPIRLLVSFPPGGASDLVARTLGQPLGARLGQPVVVENRPGSNGNLAGDLAAHATPKCCPPSISITSPAAWQMKSTTYGPIGVWRRKLAPFKR
jgi:tripartite-type tricarboxylate transporter receptor subunit TctC